jgi:Tol biopolymer transport system component
VQQALPPGSSPVTNAILFSADSTDCTACLDTGIYQVSFDGANLVRLPVTGLFPAWTDNFRRIAYIRNGELFLANADGSAEVQVTHAYMRLGAPSWGTAGPDVLAACQPDRAIEICLIDPETGRVRSVESAELTDKPTAILYWISERDGMIGGDDLTFNVAGQVIDTIPLSGRVSPNRERIAHIVDRQLAVSTILGEETRALTTDTTTKGFPIWSPDGQLIVFSVAPGDGFIYLFAVRADGNTPAYQLVARPIARGPEARPDVLETWLGYGWAP